MKFTFPTPTYISFNFTVLYPTLMSLVDSSETTAEIFRSWPSLHQLTENSSPAARAFRESLSTQRGPPIHTPGPINRVPPEILSKVFVLAALSNLTTMADGTTTFSTYFPMVLCHVSSDWRQVAFSTPQLWENLSTRVVLSGAPHEISPGTLDLDKLLVRKKSIEFLTWWAANVRDTNTSALRIELIWEEFAEFFFKARGSETITVLGETGYSTLLGLVCRARYLHLQNYSDSFAYLWRHPASASVPGIYFPSMESLVFQDDSGHDPMSDMTDVGFQKVPFHLMPALRKLRVGHPELRDPLGLEIPCPNIQTSLINMWGRLTHIHLRISTTLVGLNAFIGTCIALESARIGVRLSDWLDDNISSFPQGSIRTLPNLRELCLDVFDPSMAFTEANIFQDLHFPALKTLVFGTRLLSRRLLHLLVQATPSLERLHIQNCFPAVLTDISTDLTGMGQLIWESGDISEGHLKEYVPNLKQLLVKIPHADEYAGPIEEHAGSILRSGLLQGPWRNGPLCVELIWSPQCDDGDHLEIQQLHQFLDSRMDVDEDVDISVREISTSPFSLDFNLVVPLWDAWFDLEANFCRSKGGASRLTPIVCYNFSYASIF